MSECVFRTVVPQKLRDMKCQKANNFQIQKLVLQQTITVNEMREVLIDSINVVCYYINPPVSLVNHLAVTCKRPINLDLGCPEPR